MLKRIFDFFLALFSFTLLLPLLIFITVLIKLTSKGSVFYFQVRVGKNNKDFKIFKFRTMVKNADKSGVLTIGGKDPRVTKIGYYLRKYKLDELPQLINVLLGSMSFVGPRPEVRKYVEMYTQEQKMVLNVRPGITDMASIEFKNENEILALQNNPDQYYINVIMPRKLEINIKYLKERSLLKDFLVVSKTFNAILK